MLPSSWGTHRMMGLFPVMLSLCFLLYSSHLSHSAPIFEGNYTVETIFNGISHDLYPYDISVDMKEEFLFVLDKVHSNIVKLSLPLNQNSKVELVAGSPEGKEGYVDGKSKRSLFARPRSLAVDSRCCLYIADTANNAIRRVKNSDVTTIAGGLQIGYVDGPGENAKFSGDFRLEFISTACTLLIVDVGNQLIRRIQLEPTDCCPSASCSEVMLASFAANYKSGYHVETLFSGNKLGIAPNSVHASATADNLFILDNRGSRILKVQLPLDQNSTVEQIAGSAVGKRGYIDGEPREALFLYSRSLTTDCKGNIYIADSGNFALRKISTGISGVVTTVAGGSTNKSGYIDGPGVDARFSGDFSIKYISRLHSLLIVDTGNRAIRQIQLNRDDCTRTRSSDTMPWIPFMLILFIGIIFLFIVIKRRISCKVFNMSAHFVMQIAHQMRMLYYDMRSVLAETFPLGYLEALCRASWQVIVSLLLHPFSSQRRRENLLIDNLEFNTFSHTSDHCKISHGCLSLIDDTDLIAEPSFRQQILDGYKILGDDYNLIDLTDTESVTNNLDGERLMVKNLRTSCMTMEEKIGRLMEDNLKAFTVTTSLDAKSLALKGSTLGEGLKNLKKQARSY